MSEDLSKLSKRELVMELEEVRGLLQDTTLTLQSERESSAARIADLEEAVEAEVLKVASQALRVQKIEECNELVKGVSLKDRQKVKDLEKKLEIKTATLEVTIEECNKAQEKRRKEVAHRRELEQKIMELSNAKKSEEETSREESNQDGVAAAGDACDTPGNSPTIG